MNLKGHVTVNGAIVITEFVAQKGHEYLVCGQAEAER